MPLRQTNQRAAVRDAIEAADRPLTPQEILGLAQVDLPGLGIATVYRTVKVGTEEGWLTPVELPNGPTRYEPAGKKHHHHFECTACNAVFELEGCPTPPSKLRPMVPEGCELTGHELILYGLCGSCR
ncbi:MAG: transcriptional repressor [Planctomycetota bacterium]